MVEEPRRMHIGPIETYEFLWQHQKEENRLLSERTTIFLAASSILFLAFVMLFQESIINASVVKWLRIVLPILGMFITSVFLSLAQGTVQALEFLWNSQKRLEKEEQVFSSMKDKGLAPQIERKAREERKCGVSRFLTKNASQWLIPFTFFLLWFVSLIFASISLVP